MRTLRAELRCRRQLPTALGARPGQRRGAFLAKLRACLVLMLAPRTFHRPELPAAARQSPAAPPVDRAYLEALRGSRLAEVPRIGGERLLDRSGLGSIDRHFY